MKDTILPSAFIDEINSTKLKATYTYRAILGMGGSPLFQPLPVNPLFEVIQTAQNSMASVFKQIETMRQMLQAQWKMYQQVMEAARQALKDFLQFIGQLQLPNLNHYWSILVNFGRELRQRISLYLVMKRAARGDPKAFASVVQLFPLELRRYPRLVGEYVSKQDISSFIVMKFMELEKSFGDIEDQTLDVLFDFMDRLTLYIRDGLRKLARELQAALVNEKGIFESLIVVDGTQYALIPSLSISTRVPESTLRRWANQGLLEARKLPYRSAHTGHISPAWHIAFTSQNMDLIKELQSLPPRKSKKIIQGYLSRREAVLITGVPESTLKRWEKKGLINPEHVGRSVYYSSNNLEEITTILNGKHQSGFSLQKLSLNMS